MLRIAPDQSTIVPNVCKAFEFTPDGKTLTMYLRKGMKWSDGAPFSADDILFWWEDVMLNEELTPSVPGVFTPGGEAMVVEKVDDYTIKMYLTKASPSFLINLADPYVSVQWSIFPPRRLSRNYTETELDSPADSGGSLGERGIQRLFPPLPYICAIINGRCYLYLHRRIINYDEKKADHIRSCHG